MAKLAGNAMPPRLAEAGDHIDFLVTLVDSGTETVGRLERQTRAGTVAIRELRDSSCARVAEGLALSLGLALEPGQVVLDETSPAAAAQPAGGQVAPDPALTLSPLAPPQVAPAPSATHEVPAAAQRTVAIGAAAGVLYGLAPRPIARAQMFVDLDPFWAQLGSKLSARLGAVGAFGSTPTRIGSVRSYLVGGYVEGCPWRLRATLFSLRPCLGFELGASGVTHTGGAGFRDHTVWATPNAELLLSASLPHGLGVEANAGALVPILRDQVFAGSSTLYSAEIVLFQASLGLSVELP